MLKELEAKGVKSFVDSCKSRSHHNNLDNLVTARGHCFLVFPPDASFTPQNLLGRFDFPGGLLPVSKRPAV